MWREVGVFAHPPHPELVSGPRSIGQSVPWAHGRWFEVLKQVQDEDGEGIDFDLSSS
jgi:hypothetical protein